MIEDNTHDYIFQFNVLVPPRLFGIGQRTQKELYFSRHKHTLFTEIIYIKNAKGYVKHKDKRYDIKEPCIIIFNPYAEHEEYYESVNDDDIQLYHVCLADYIVNSEKNGNIIPNNYPFILPVSEDAFNDLEYTLKKMLREYTSASFGTGHLLPALCISLYIMTLRLYNESYNCFSNIYDYKDFLVESIKNYIDANFKKCNFSVLDLEKALHLSHYYLSTIFKKKAGITIKEYLINKRMSFSKERLLNSSDSISEIAKEAGYNDIYNFFKQFKKRYNITAKEYRSLYSKK